MSWELEASPPGVCFLWCGFMTSRVVDIGKNEGAEILVKYSRNVERSGCLLKHAEVSHAVSHHSSRS